MTRKLVWLFLTGTLSISLAAADLPGTISGTVHDAAGTLQLGARVEVFLAAPGLARVNASTPLTGLSPIPAASVISDARGFFEIPNLAAGTYLVKVTAPSFLPLWREDLRVAAGANLMVDVTLKTLAEVLETIPTRQRTPADQDDWKWTLRSAANRPVSRLLEPGPDATNRRAAPDSDDAAFPLKGEVTMVAGSESDGFGSSPDMTTVFKMERSLFSSGTIALGGNVNYAGDGITPGTVLRASYSHQMQDGSDPLVAFTVRRFATPDMVAHDAALQALSVLVSDQVRVGDFLILGAGSEYQTVQFMGRVSAVRPNGSAALELTPNTVLEYRYATAVPNTRAMKGFDSAPADLSESGPMVSLANYTPVLEKSRHHELSLARRVGKNTTVEAAVYSDRVSNPALTGVGFVTSDSGFFLPDYYSGTFTWGGPGLSASGLRVVTERDLTPNLEAIVDYAYGGALALNQSGGPVSLLGVASSIETERRGSLACKLAGNLPKSHTRWIASYRANLGGSSLTPVDMFNVSPGQTDPYLSLFIRQPLPKGFGFLRGRTEALLDIRNLLAQGYLPVVGSDGQTLYLVQSARAVRGGVAFTF